MTTIEYGEYTLGFFKSRYVSNNNLYIGLVDMSDRCMYGDVTTNIRALSDNLACIDTNNMPGLDKILTDAGLAIRTGSNMQSGYCTYPVLDLSPLVERLNNENPAYAANM